MTDELRQRLAGELAETTWTALRPHAERDAVIVVSQGLDLARVGACVAGDDQRQVAAWIEAGRLGKPTRQQLEGWAEEPERRFRLLIVQPYVLVQPMSDA